MANDVKDLRFRVLAQVLGTDAIKELDNEIKKVSSSAASSKDKFSGLVSGVKALAGAFVVQQAVTFSKSLIDMGDELQALSEKTGVLVEDLAGFKVAAETGNLGLDSLTKYLAKLSLGIAEASTGNKSFVADFKAVGVAFNDGNGKIRSTGDVVKDLSDKFSKMSDGPGKAALAIKLFGKSGAEMIPFLNQGRQELEKFAGSIDGDFAKRSDQFNDSLAVMKKNIQGLGVSGLKEILPTLQEIVNTFNSQKSSGDGLPFFRALGEGIRIAVIGFTTLWEVSKNLVDRIISYSKLAVNEINFFLTSVGDNIATRAKQIASLATGDLQKANKLGDELEARTDERKKLRLEEREKIQKEFAAREMERIKTIANTYRDLSKNSLVLGKGSSDEIAGRQKEATDPGETKKKLAADLSAIAAERKVERDRVQEFIDQAKLENKQRKEALGDIGLTVLELRKATEARKLDAEAIKTSKTMTEEQKKALMSATEEIKKERDAVIELEYQQKRTFTYGAREYLRTYLDEVTNNANAVKQVFGTAFRSLEDTMVEFLKTGRLNFKKFADDVINELLRIAVRQAIISPIANAFVGAIAGAAGGAAAGGGSGSQIGSSTYSSAASSGAYTFAKGGIMTDMGPVPLRAYAKGGIANSPQMALYGEGSTPEAFVPLPDGRSIPVNMKGGGGDMNVSVMVNVSRENESSSVQSDKAIGKNLGELISSSIRQELIKQKRPGGLLT